MNQDQMQRTRPPGWGLPIGAGVGAGFGLVVGILLDQVAMGLAIGAAIGVVVGTLLTALGEVPTERRRATAVTALAILGLGIVVTLFLWLRF